MTELEIAVALEKDFRKFKYDIPFDSSCIRNRPRETIIEGLCFLRTIDVINDEELAAHKENYTLWADMPLRDVLTSPCGKDQINALRNVLNYWSKQNSQE